MTVDAGLIAWIAEAAEPLGALTKRAMMGGATLYLDGHASGSATHSATGAPAR